MPIVFLRLDIPEQCSEKELIKVAVREVRRQARQMWRSENKHIPNVGGRPKLEKAVWEACDSVWKEWGKKFPKHQSTMNALVRTVSARIPWKGRSGKEGIRKTRREDLRTIEKYVRHWIECSLTAFEVPESWLRMPKNRKIIRSMAWMAGVGAILKNDFTPTVMAQVSDALQSSTDKQLVGRLLRKRREMS